MNKPFGNCGPEAVRLRRRASTRPRTRCWPRSARAAPPPGCPTSRSRRSTRLHLEVLARAAGARRAVEIGTLGGYSGVALLRGMGPTASSTRSSCRAQHAEVARESFRRAGVAARARVHVGAAADVLPQLAPRGPVRPGVHRRRQGGLSRPTSTGRPTTCAPAASCCSTTPSCSAASPTAPTGDRAAQIRAMQSVHEMLARSGQFRGDGAADRRGPRLRRPALTPSPACGRRSG